MTDSIFGSEDKPVQDSQAVNTETEAKTETKIDVEAVTKRLNDSQAFIEKLKRENAELKSVADKAKSIDAILEKLQKQEETKSEHKPEGDSTPALDTSKFVTKDDLLNERVALERATKARDNARTVASALKAQFGDKAEEVFNKKAQELGKTIESFHALAMDDPKIVLGLFKQTDTRTSAASSTDAVRTESVLTKSTSSEEMKTLVDAMKNPWTMNPKTFSDLESKLMDKYSKK